LPSKRWIFRRVQHNIIRWLECIIIKYLLTVRHAYDLRSAAFYTWNVRDNIIAIPLFRLQTKMPRRQLPHPANHYKRLNGGVLYWLNTPRLRIRIGSPTVSTCSWDRCVIQISMLYRVKFACGSRGNVPCIKYAIYFRFAADTIRGVTINHTEMCTVPSRRFRRQSLYNNS